VIDLYTWTTPNGRKVSILLEELGLPYTVHAVDINKGEQFQPSFLAISPNNKIPAIVDQETGTRLMESGGIMLYLADKAGQLIPREGEPRYRVIEWLMWQMGGIGPMLGQLHHFVRFNKGVAPTRRGGSWRRRGAFMVFSIIGSQIASSWPIHIPSRISRSGRGSLASSGRRSISTSIQT
jgi:glutathione S-transferase